MPPPTKLQLAHERFCLEGYNSTDHAEMHEQPLQRSRDASLLAREYVKEHPADEDEPVTKDHLRDLGGEIKACDSRWCKVVAHIPLPGKGNALAVSVAIDGMVDVAKIGKFGEVSYLVSGSNITIGQVRRLYSALNIEPKEGK